MHADIVDVPEIHVRLVYGKDFLNFGQDLPSFCAVHFHSFAIEQSVECRVAIVAAIGAVGREAFGGEGKLKKIGAGVGGIRFDEEGEGGRIVGRLGAGSGERTDGGEEESGE